MWYCHAFQYYGARYYDPQVGLFLSADPIQGNGEGLNPYAYVAENPETFNDPSGRAFIVPDAGGGGGSPAPSPKPSPSPSHDNSNSGGGFLGTIWNAVKTVGTAVLDATTGIPSMVNDVQTIFFSSASWQEKLLAGGDLLLNIGMDALSLTGVGEIARVGLHVLLDAGEHIVANVVRHTVADVAEHALAESAEHAAADSVEHATAGQVERASAAAESGACSFTYETPVRTAQGEQAIGTLHVGQQVVAYNPQAHQEDHRLVTPYVHVPVHTKGDLADLIRRHSPKNAQASPALL